MDASKTEKENMYLNTCCLSLQDKKQGTRTQNSIQQRLKTVTNFKQTKWMLAKKRMRMRMRMKREKSITSNSRNPKLLNTWMVAKQK